MVITGVWNHDITSITMTTAAFSTLYGAAAKWLVTALSVIFGIGVLVAYAYIGRECWLYLTNGKLLWLYNLIYCFLAFWGAIVKVQLVWDAVDIVNAGLMAINLFAILYLMPKIRAGVMEYEKA
jgi:AGCS family alanine or glycine:cation symporter